MDSYSNNKMVLAENDEETGEPVKLYVTPYFDILCAFLKALLPAKVPFRGN